MNNKNDKVKKKKTTTPHGGYTIDSDFLMQIQIAGNCFTI